MCRADARTGGRADNGCESPSTSRSRAIAPRSARPPVRLSALLALCLLAPPPVAAQEGLEQSRRRLQEIRRERDRLQEQQQRLQGQVHDVNDELTNLERQRESTQKIVD